MHKPLSDNDTIESTSESDDLDCIAWNNDLEPEGSAETPSSDLVGCMHSSVVVIASCAHGLHGHYSS